MNNVSFRTRGEVQLGNRSLLKRRSQGEWSSHRARHVVSRPTDRLNGVWPVSGLTTRAAGGGPGAGVARTGSAAARQARSYGGREALAPWRAAMSTRAYARRVCLTAQRTVDTVQQDGNTDPRGSQRPLTEESIQ